MYVGRIKLGETVPLSLWCRTPAGVPSVPDVAPTAVLYNAAGTRVATLKIPIVDQFNVTGVFRLNLFLGFGHYAVGGWRVRYQYVISGVTYHAMDTFEIVDGGNDDGTGISSHYFRRAQVAFLLVQGEGGRVLKRRNPSL